MNKKVVILILILLTLLSVAFYLDLQIQKTKQPILSITFLDVGQGDSIFIQAPNGYQVLIDGGRGEQVLKSLAKEINFYDKEIDLLIATHDDADHIGGFINIFDRYNVKNYVDGSDSGDTDVVKILDEKIKLENIQSRITLNAGQRIIVDEKNNIYLDILWPPKNITDKDRNNLSVVAELVYGESEFMLTGDAPIFVENFIVKQFPDKISSDYLKAGHHGSKTSTGELFLKSTNPKSVIISAGKENQYGHPNKEVLDLLQKNNIPYYETSQSGNVKIETDGKTENVITEFNSDKEKTLTDSQGFSKREASYLFNQLSFFKSFINTVLVHSF